MGVNISGYIEVSWAGLLERDWGAEWEPAVHLGVIMPARDYVMYHSIFGIGDMTDFAPVAGGRGVPEDASERVLKATEPDLIDDSFGHTWVTFEELLAVEWEETALVGVASPFRDGQVAGSGRTYRADDPRRVAKTDFEEDGSLWKFDTITRRDSLAGSGPLLFDLMEALAKTFGAKYVRAVVWFE